MKQIEKIENSSKDKSIATMVIEEYRALNKSYARTIKRLFTIIIILLVLFTVATTYIVLSWESMHPHTGLIREEISEWHMLKLAFTKQELETLLDVIHFTPMQRRIIKYRLDEESMPNSFPE